jgi:hypothetical protein
MPAQYQALKQKYGNPKAAKMFVGKGKSKYSRSQRAKSLKYG